MYQFLIWQREKRFKENKLLDKEANRKMARVLEQADQNYLQGP